MSHVPVEKASGVAIEIGKEVLRETQSEIREDFVVRAESQEEVNTLAEKCFNKKLTLNCEDFAYIIDNIDSGMFLCLLSLLRMHFPSLLEFRRFNLVQKDGKSVLISRPTKHKLANSKLLSRFAPVSKIAKFSRSQSFEDFSGVAAHSMKDNEAPPKYTQSKFAKNSTIKKETLTVPAVRLPNAKQDSTDLTVSPSHYLTKHQDGAQLLFCQCGKQISDFNILQCETCLQLEHLLKCEGYLFTRRRKSGKLKKMWYVVERRVMYCYTLKTDGTYKKMRNLAGCFFKEDPTERLEDRTLAYGFTLVCGNTFKKKYLCTSKEEYIKWCEVVKESIGYSDLASYYEIKVLIEVEE